MERVIIDMEKVIVHMERVIIDMEKVIVHMERVILKRVMADYY